MKSRLLSAAALAMLVSAPALAAPEYMHFDVAEDHTRFVFAPAPVHEDGEPAYGNPFITQGYIYPAGFLKPGVDGVLKNGEPAYPDKVLGTWTCDGWFVADGVKTKTGTWLISRQVYEFANGDVLISQGAEVADQGKPTRRAITGGTGDYRGIDGDVVQTLLGFTENMGVEARFEIAVAPSDRRHPKGNDAVN